ncbi:MAG: DUF4291 domain-containing protein [Saprospiraceae bacterium]
MKLEKYLNQQAKLPEAGQFIIANYDAKTITVYQAFNHQIADYAVAQQKFGGNHYSFHRMTWIKPNFMWMMYRAGWATKQNQERILALKITQTGFNQLLDKAVLSSFKPDRYESRSQWKDKLAQSEVRLQWDPDHNPLGKKLNRKAIQIGIKGETLQQFNDEWITEITDITYFVEEQRIYASGNFENLVVPLERVFIAE